MNFIRKIFEEKTDEWVHKQFTRYGKGNYEHKAIVEINKSKDAIKIKTSFEFSGELAYELANTIQGKTRVTGGIITTKLIKDELGIPIADQKQFAGVKTYLLDTDLNKQQVQELFNKFPNLLILLSFKTEDGELKSKVKSPTSAKPGKKNNEAPKAEFCTFTTKNLAYVQDFAFDVKEDFKKLAITHSYTIHSLDVPKEYSNNFELSRFHAKRKGTLLRKITLNGKETLTEKNFEA